MMVIELELQKYLCEFMWEPADLKTIEPSFGLPLGGAFSCIGRGPSLSVGFGTFGRFPFSF
jgi:hypothetical protein